MIERARPDDLAALVKLVETKEYPGSRIAGIDARLRQQSDLNALTHHWDSLLANPQVAIWVARKDQDVGAYCIVGLGGADFASGQPETVVVEHAGQLALYPDLLESVKQSVEDDFLAIRLYPEQPTLREVLQSCGFAPEFSRVVRCTQGARRPELPEGLTVRPAVAADRAFLAQLHIDCSSFYESSNRHNVGWGALSALDNYLSLDLAGDVLGWVAEYQGRPAGYVLLRREFGLEMLPTMGAYLYDIAVSKPHWGRNLVVFVHEVAAVELGYKTIVGDISAHNSRALHVAMHKLQYRLEWERWGLNL
ncbi:GNAT family N-acetyltransferase [bacterium]|nr:GNAT family N-acetyltransferase [bacterium]